MKLPQKPWGLWPLQYQDLEKHHSCSYVLLLISNEGSCAFFKHCPYAKFSKSISPQSSLVLDVALQGPMGKSGVKGTNGKVVSFLVFARFMSSECSLVLLSICHLFILGCTRGLGWTRWPGKIWTNRKLQLSLFEGALRNETEQGDYINSSLM